MSREKERAISENIEETEEGNDNMGILISASEKFTFIFHFDVQLEESSRTSPEDITVPIEYLSFIK